jgi:predicted enzyme related to lactoylglutathione lyase
MPGFATMAMINLDSENPAELAAFYSQVLGWDVLHSQDEYAMIGDGSTSIGFGKVSGYSGPGWPRESAPKRYHLDFYVDDLDKAEEQALALGATKPDEQPTPDRWRVLLDPAGHPFDLCLR